LIDWYLEDFEDEDAKRDVGKSEQPLHGYPPILVLPFSSSEMRRRMSSISLAVTAGAASDLEKPQPRSGRYAIAQIQRNGHST
jgi:hypothetical protein